eukprot:3603775-Rhodomonas_salina.1
MAVLLRETAPPPRSVGSIASTFGDAVSINSTITSIYSSIASMHTIPVSTNAVILASILQQRCRHRPLLSSSSSRLFLLPPHPPPPPPPPHRPRSALSRSPELLLPSALAMPPRLRLAAPTPFSV